MKAKDLKVHHYVMGLGLVVIVLGGITGGDTREQNQQVAQQARERAQEIRLKENEFNFDDRETELADETAVRRYQNGLVFVVAVNDPTNAIGIVEGEPVVHLVSRQPLPDGTVVGDYLGNTGILKDGVVSSVAFTGNQEVIRAAKEAADFTRFEQGNGHDEVIGNDHGG